jgi:hypothetical protein
LVNIVEPPYWVIGTPRTGVPRQPNKNAEFEYAVCHGLRMYNP